ncbi:hypothetical protein AGMMS49982_09370 [Bacteroidia bacterium]|nr:hypothetical protein AGMMS49982_09370 [Bacteroidia bacterium]
MVSFKDRTSEFDLRSKVKDAYFSKFKVEIDSDRIDFLVHSPKSLFAETFLWAESKKDIAEINKTFAQLILTIKRQYDNDVMPPKYLGIFDKEKIAFIEFHHIVPIFCTNDFNWNETPSSVSKKTELIVSKYLVPRHCGLDPQSPEKEPNVGQQTDVEQGIAGQARNDGDSGMVVFNFATDEKELREFIAENFVAGQENTNKIQITKNNFVIIYNKWLKEVWNTIQLSVEDQKDLYIRNVNEADFFRADVLSVNNKTLEEKLQIILQDTFYKSKVHIEGRIRALTDEIRFKDGGKAHTRFWNKYERPPRGEYYQFIFDRRDLLIPQNIRERKGAFFTPQIWVRKSQEYLAKTFGNDWQSEYYVWDCCAGTGNLEVGLTNTYNVWASTLDHADVAIMQSDGNLLPEHVFQFDFLNDSFDKLPESLRDVINDPEKQRRLLIYINPPIAEASAGIGRGANKKDVAKTKAAARYSNELGKSKNELFAQFLIRIYRELPHASLGMFSTLKYLNSANFVNFRSIFNADFLTGFIVPADTFDNVDGLFPYAFLVWRFSNRPMPQEFEIEVFDKKDSFIKNKKYFTNKGKYINDWIKTYTPIEKKNIGYLCYLGTDFQHNNELRISPFIPTSHISTLALDKDNLLTACVYFAVRHCIESTWLNDRDQFLYPTDGYKTDTEFQNDCLIYTLFHSQNKIVSVGYVNHWLPFYPQDVKAKDNFKSTFMADFLAGKKTTFGGGGSGGYAKQVDVFMVCEPESQFEYGRKPREFSPVAQTVFDAGKALWAYYHATLKSDAAGNVNASLYEIREYFKGRNGAGRMNSSSTDEQFAALDTNLKNELKKLGLKIQPKVYEYGFLKE